MSQFNVSPETKAQYLQDRIAQLNAEGYAHELNKKTGEAIGDEKIVSDSESAIAIILSAIEVAKAELNNLDAL